MNLSKEYVSSELDVLRDEVQQKIGRNLLFFQQIESRLKLLIKHSEISGNLSTLEQNRQERDDMVQNKTMGTLAKLYVDDVLQNSSVNKTEIEGADELIEEDMVMVSMRYTVSGDSDFCNSQSENLKKMVKARNHLVHHFLSHLQPETQEKLTSASAYLDQQREDFLPMFHYFQTALKSWHEMVTFLDATDFELLFLQASPLVKFMHEIALSKARSDGWLALADAGNLARLSQPDEMLNMKERYGYSTLKKLLLAAELFELCDELLSNGKTRALYKIKSVVHH